MHLPLGRLLMGPLLFAGLLAATACSSDAGREEVTSVAGGGVKDEVSSADGVMTLKNGARLIIGKTSDSGGDVAVEGSIATRDDCVGLQLGSRFYTAVFPDGTTAALESGQLIVRSPNGTPTREGELYTGSGSFVAADSLPGTSEVPRGCRTEEVVVLNTEG